MSSRTSRRTRIRWVRVVGVLAAVVAIAAYGHQLSTAAPSVEVVGAEPPRAADDRGERGAAARDGRGGGAAGGPLGQADGAVPDGTTVFDDDVPGVARLDPELLAAVRRAATDAGLTFLVDSGWRSADYQQHLLRDAIAQYGSEAEAARWVAAPGTSAHESGDAVDIGPADAAAWLAANGARYGLCQIYGNEPWHYELRPEAAANGCPPMYADPTQDPRMRR